MSFTNISINARTANPLDSDLEQRCQVDHGAREQRTTVKAS